MLIVSVLIASCLILLTERLSRKNNINKELSRKIPHTIIATTIAFWPLFVDMKYIAYLGVVFVLAAWLVAKLNLFPSARSITRKSGGEYFFGLGFGAAALLNPAPWIFALAMLYVGLADTVAALVGNKYGKHKFIIFGQKKSLEGSLGFFVTAVLITFGFAIFNPASALYLNLLVILFLPLLATFVEAVALYGLDNLAIPLLVVATLGVL